MLRLAVLFVVIAAVTTGCGSRKAATPTTTASAAPRKVKVYFVSGEQFRAVTRAVAPGENVARAAIQALLDGPTNAESNRGVETTIPGGARVDTLSVSSGTATVAFSHAQTKATAFDVSLRPARAAQVVYTLTASSGAPGYETNAGSFKVFRKERNSWSYPYQVWLPWASYFDGGIAFHEYKDVPPYPASHGCVRVSAPEARFVYEFATMGTPVTVY